MFAQSHLAALIALGALSILSSNNFAYGDDYDDYRAQVREIMLRHGRTAPGPARDACVEELRQARDDYHRRVRRNKGYASIGGTFVDNSFVAFHGYPGPVSQELTFSWVDTETVLPTSGPPIAGVLYESCMDWEGTDWERIGLSSNIPAGFDYFFTPAASVIWVRGTPLDGVGNPIVLADGEHNLAVGLAVVGASVPEPIGGGAVLTLVACAAGIRRRAVAPAAT